MIRLLAISFALVWLTNLGCGDGTGAMGGNGGAGGVAGTGGSGGTSGTGGTGASGGGGRGGSGGTGGSEVSPKRIFVTVAGQNASFGGISGADAVCATEASDAGLQGVFKAWLSTASSAAADRLVHSNGAYVRIDGEVIAQDWDDLVDGFIDVPINVGPAGQPLSGDVWTGTLVNGQPYLSGDCDGFTNSDPSGRALCGSSASTANPWTQSSTPNCSSTLRLYCVEQ